MSRLDELIQELCPNGVEFLKVSLVCKVVTPKVKIKSYNYLERGDYPVIHQGQKYIGGYTNEQGAYDEGQYVIFGDHTCVIKYVDFQFVQVEGFKDIVTEKDKNTLVEEIRRIIRSSTGNRAKESLIVDFINQTGLNEILPKMSPLNPGYHTKKQNVFEKISAFVEKFKRVGGAI